MGRMEDIDARLKSRMDAMNNRLADRMAALNARVGGRDKESADIASEGRGGGTVARSTDTAASSVLQKQGLNARNAGMGIDAKLMNYFCPNEAEMVQLFEFVRHSPVVQENSQYSKIMNAARFVYVIDSRLKDADVVNAFATYESRDSEGNPSDPAVYFLGGAAKIGRIASLAVAARKYGGDGDAVRRFVNFLKGTSISPFSDSDAVMALVGADLLNALDDDALQIKARDIAAGLVLGIIAHEVGHLVLGHLASKGGVNYYQRNRDISRNQERDADSFASSVLASSPFGEPVLEGTLLWFFILASQEEGSEESTHPLSKERFENFVRANPDLAKSLGF